MFIKKYFFAIFLLLLIVSCKKEEKFVIRKGLDYDIIQLSIDSSQVKFDISYPYFKDESFVSKKLNSFIKSIIISDAENLKLQFENDASFESIINQIVISDLNSFRESNAVQTELNLDTNINISQDNSFYWYNTYSISVIKNDSNVICIESTRSFWQGGAHPNYYKVFFNINPANADTISILSIIKNYKKFETAAEKEFRRKYKINENMSYHERNIFWEDNKFKLSNNIGFIKDSVVVFYNNYDIAPYSEGSFEITIPISATK